MRKNWLIGKWHVVCWNINGVGGWRTIRKFADNELVYEFLSKGILIESGGGDPPATTKYTFFCDDLKLYIDRSDYAADGYMLACIEEHYRVDFLSPRYMILYDLEDVTVEPDDYTILVELEKV